MAYNLKKITWQISSTVFQYESIVDVMTFIAG